MIRRLLISLFSLLLIGLLFVIVSMVLFGESSAAGTLASGRSVSATGSGWYLSLNTTTDTATIRSPGRTIVVAPTTLQIDGKPVASIAATAKSVSVRIEGSEVAFTADGQPIRLQHR